MRYFDYIYRKNINMEKIIIDGFSFLPQANTKSKEKRYYQGWTKINGIPRKLRLHQYIWIKNFGEIPKGFHIHHIDENIFNNDISNLQCISASDHLKHHWANVKQSTIDKMQVNLDNIRHLTKEWHGSEDGKKWHSENSKKMWLNKQPVKRNCDCCGVEYEKINISDTRFCTNKCKSQYRRNQRVDDITVKCSICNADYTKNKYVKGIYCKSCRYKKK